MDTDSNVCVCVGSACVCACICTHLICKYKHRTLNKELKLYLLFYRITNAFVWICREGFVTIQIFHADLEACNCKTAHNFKGA